MSHTQRMNLCGYVEPRMATILYGRVSTTEQTIEHQLSQAEAAGFKFDRPPIFDHGVSGVTTKLRDRENGKRLFDILRAGDTLVVRWIDRLGRNYDDITDIVREFMRRGVVIRTVINGGFSFDGATKEPIQMAVRDALLAFMAATAQAQTEATKEAQRAGIDHAKKIQTRYLGRKPTYTRAHVTLIRQLASTGSSVGDMMKATGLSRQTVHRIVDDPNAAQAALELWAEAARERAERTLQAKQSPQ
jgi:putative DNA-invertase from lambdoid prophage Rac